MFPSYLEFLSSLADDESTDRCFDQMTGSPVARRKCGLPPKNQSAEVATNQLDWSMDRWTCQRIGWPARSQHQKIWTGGRASESADRRAVGTKKTRQILWEESFADVETEMIAENIFLRIDGVTLTKHVFWVSR